MTTIVKERAKNTGPGPTLARFAGVVFWVTLDCLVPASLIVSHHGNNIAASINAELLLFDISSSGIDLCVLAVLRSVAGTAVGFAVGKWFPLAFAVHFLGLIVGVVKMAIVPASWWDSGHHVALAICYACFGVPQMYLCWLMRKLKIDTSQKNLHDLSKLEGGTRTKRHPGSSSVERLLQLARPEKTILFFGTVALVIANIAVMVIPALFGQLPSV